MAIQRQPAVMRNLCEITSSKRIFAADYQTEGVPFFRGKEITEKYNGALEIGTELFIARDKFEEIKAKFGVPKAGDLLLTSVGTLGSTYVVKPGDEFYFKDGNITWFRNLKDLDSRYLHYWLSSPAGRAELKKCTIGSSQSAYTIVLLKEMCIDLPPLPMQHHIASILSAYDDLIENNTRRIAILEEMARRIYEEWFVHFRFPGHEQARLVESELGLIPEGWQVALLADLIVFIGGAQPPKSEHIYNVQPGYIRFVQNRDYSSSQHLTYIHESKKNKICDRFDIMIDKYGEAGRTRYGIAGAYNVALAKISPKNPLQREWLRGFLSQDQFRQYLANASQASTRASLNSAHFNVRVAIPNTNLLAGFEATALPILKLILTLGDKNANLRATRDLLLPKLISGELDVSHLP